MNKKPDDVVAAYKAWLEAQKKLRETMYRSTVEALRKYDETKKSH